MELAALSAAGADAVISLARLSHGSTGAEVSVLQTALEIAATGTFDPDTKLALTKFEQASPVYA